MNLPKVLHSMAAPTAQPIDDFADKNRLAQLPSAVQVPNPHSDIIDTSQLPDEVKAQLRNFDQLELDDLLMKILSAPGAGAVKVDKIILTLWLTYQKRYDRMKVITRLRSLVKQGYVQKLEGSMSTYALINTAAK